MGFNFTHVCNLLSSLEGNQILKALSASRKINPDISTVTNWFSRHRRQIDSEETDGLALLSCLLPEKRPERVFGLREPSLVKIIGRCLLLGTSRKRGLDQWRRSGGGDLGQCVENVMREAENQLNPEGRVTVEDIDAALNKIASRCRFSGKSIRQRYDAADVDEALTPIFRRLSSRDAKWFTRMILKNYSPVVLPAKLILRNFHFLLPDLLRFQDSFEAALEILGSDPIKPFPSQPDPQYSKLLSQLALSHLSPRIGVKIGRPEFYKARSIKHCCSMAGKRTMSLERKYDGEYCQIHIDISGNADPIRIFSKSGKDSTTDKRGIHKIVEECLGIGQHDCKFSRRCILEGELLVWSDSKSEILAFHKLRKHISRSGSFLGTERDSQPHPDEHLFIMFFDILLVDDDVCFSKSYRERRGVLKATVKPIDGRAGIAEQETINFSLPNSKERLRDAFARAIARRWEGFVLKGFEEPYFTFLLRDSNQYSSRWIKLKKDYIPGLGDTADLAIIGARYDASEAGELREIKKLSWTSFFVGCLEEKNNMTPDSARPAFRVVDVLSRPNLSIHDMRTLNQLGQFRSCDFDTGGAGFDVRIDQTQLPKIEVVFKTPFVAEMSGSGFEKPPSVNYFSLRFPRVLKIHSDRTVDDAITFTELQRLAQTTRSIPTEELSQEAAVWSEKLAVADGKPEYIVSTSQGSSSSGDLTCLSTLASPEHPRSNMMAHMVPKSQQISSKEPCQGTNEGPFLSLAEEVRSTTEEPSAGSPPRKKRKGSNAKSYPVTVLQDRMQSINGAESTSLDMDCSPDHHLKELTNDSQPRRSQTRTAHGQLQSFLPPLPGEDGPDCSAPLKNASKDNRPAHEPLHKQPSPPCDSSQQTRCTGPRHSHASKKGKKVISPSILYQDTTCVTHPRLSPPLSSVPILLGSTLFEPTTGTVAHGLVSPDQPFSFSVSHFLDAMIDSHVDSPPKGSSFRSSTSSCYRGVVLVDSNISYASSTASDIALIGNTLAVRQRDGRVTNTGRIVFLHWGVLQLDKDSYTKGEDSRQRWERFGEAVFAGCLKWGFSLPSARRQRRMSSIERDAQEGRVGTNSLSGVDVMCSWDWKEVLSLLSVQT